jgi:ribosomal-protein-alanine N-acetyltransferase
MRKRDLTRVIDIERSAYAFPWSEGIFRDCMRVGYLCLVGEMAAGVVAYSIMSVVTDEAHILNLCVDPRFQGHGHGRGLLLQLLERARKAEVKNMYLEARPSNPAAIALYQSCGFNEIGVRRGYYPARKGREDALVLAKYLPSADWPQR